MPNITTNCAITYTNCPSDAVMDSIRNYDQSETENNADMDCSNSETRLQLPLNQV